MEMCINFSLCKWDGDGSSSPSTVNREFSGMQSNDYLHHLVACSTDDLEVMCTRFDDQAAMMTLVCFGDLKHEYNFFNP